MHRYLTPHLRLHHTASVLCDVLAYVMRMCIRVVVRRILGAFDVPLTHGALITYRVLELAGGVGGVPTPQRHLMPCYITRHNDKHPATLAYRCCIATLACDRVPCVYTIVWGYDDAPRYRRSAH
jgi:hypothetical protein